MSYVLAGRLKLSPLLRRSLTCMAVNMFICESHAYQFFYVLLFRLESMRDSEGSSPDHDGLH